MVDSQLNRQIVLLLKHPLTHTWTSPLTRIVSFHVQAKQLANLIESHQPRPGETSDQPQALALLPCVSQQDTCTGESSRGISFIPLLPPPPPPPRQTACQTHRIPPAPARGDIGPASGTPPPSCLPAGYMHRWVIKGYYFLPIPYPHPTPSTLPPPPTHTHTQISGCIICRAKIQVFNRRHILSL